MLEKTLRLIAGSIAVFVLCCAITLMHQTNKAPFSAEASPAISGHLIETGWDNTHVWKDPDTGCEYLIRLDEQTGRNIGYSARMERTTSAVIQQRGCKQN